MSPDAVAPVLGRPPAPAADPSGRVPSRGVTSRGVTSRGVTSRGVTSRGVPSRGVPSAGGPSRGTPWRGARAAWRWSRARTALAVLALLVAGAVAAFVLLGAQGPWSFVLPLRATKVAAMVLVAYAIAVSTVLFRR